MADRKKTILIILAVISIFIWMRGMGVSIKGGQKKFQPASGSASPVYAARQARRSEYRGYKRNPFVAASVSQSQGQGFQLAGIISDENGLYALINDQIAHLGDKIGEYAVIDITQGKVILNDGAKNIELKLQE